MKHNLVLGIVLTLGVIIGVTATRLLDAQPVPVKSTDLLQTDVVGMDGVEVLSAL